MSYAHTNRRRFARRLERARGRLETRRVHLEHLEPRTLLAVELVQPVGSLIHKQLDAGAFEAANETDSFSLTADSGQTLAFRLTPSDASIQARLELYDTSNTLVSSFDAGSAGETVGLQAFGPTVSGSYRLDVKNLAGQGGYELETWLNAELETEGLSGGGPNDDFLTQSQSLESSSISFPTGADRLAVVGTSDIAGLDSYQFFLDAGEKVTLAAASHSGTSITLKLVHATLGTFAQGIATGQENVAAIRDFTAPQAGFYHALISTQTGEQRYSLVVTRGSAFDLEPNSGNGKAQDISHTNKVLGALKQNVGGSAIHVAVVDRASGGDSVGFQAIVDQLNDSTAFDFDAVLVAPSDADTLAELEAYDVVVTGNNGYFDGDPFSVIATPLRDWVLAGGGLVVTGWSIYGMGDAISTLDPVIPVNVAGSYTFFNSGVTLTPVGSHEIVQGLASFVTGGSTYTEYPSGSPKLDSGAVELMLVGSTPVAAAGEPGQGRGVYLGPIYTGASDYNTTSLRTGAADQLMEQAVSWAAFGGKIDVEDNFQIEVTAGDSLTIETTTPFDAANDPENTLDPILELYGPDGTLVSSNNNGGVDGKNAHIQVVAADTGTYRVRLAPVSGEGAYTLQVAGATGAPFVPDLVAQASIADGAVLTQFPAYIDLSLSAAFHVETIDPSDLKLNGVDATSVEILDGKTARFTTAGPLDGDAVYDVVLQAGAFEGLFGQPVEELQFSFTFDGTAPVVVSGTLNGGDVLAPGPLTVVVKFSEALDTTQLNSQDFYIYNQFIPFIRYPSSFSYDASKFEATLEFAALGEGSYSFSIASTPSAARDLAGNLLDGEFSGTYPSGNGAAGGYFNLFFNVDVATVDLPPFTNVGAFGSLSFESTYDGAFTDGDTQDVFEADLDGGQTLTVVFTPDASNSAAAEIEILDSGGNSLGIYSGAVDEAFAMPVIPIATADTYQVVVRSTGGFGAFELRALLNTEVERPVTGFDGNDDFYTPQPIDSAWLDAGLGVWKTSVVGDFRPKYGSDESIITLYKPVYETSGGYYEGASLDSLVDNQFLSRGSFPSDGAVYWSGTDVTFEIDLGAVTPIQYGRVQADDNDSYVLEYYEEATGNWYTLWDIPNYDEYGDGMINRPDPEFDVTEWVSLGGVQARYVRLRAVEGDDFYAVSEIQLTTYDEMDHYSFHLNEGETVSLNLTPSSGYPLGGFATDFWVFNLYTETGTWLAQGDFESGDNVDQSILDFTAPETGTYVVQIAGGVAYSLLVSWESAFDQEPNNHPVFDAQDISATRKAHGAINPGSNDPDDSFKFLVTAGDTLFIRTDTPAGDAGAFTNDLDPELVLYAPDGSEVGSDTNGWDGRNAVINHVATMSGYYTVRLSSENNTAGTYLLLADGATGGLPHFEITSTSLDNDDLTSTPDNMYVVLNDAVLISSLDGAEAVIDGGLKTSIGYNPIDGGHSIIFTLPALADGIHTIEFAAGSFLDLQGTPVQGYSLQFEIDTSGPRVIASSIQEGDTHDTGDLTYVVQFDELLEASVLSGADLTLVDGNGTTYPDAGFNYESGTSTLTVDFSALPAGDYTLTLLSGANAFRDPLGWKLDGEYSGTLPSGDGVPGGDFVLHFSLDVGSVPFPTPLAALPALGAMSYRGTVDSGLTTGDVDEFSITLDALQNASISLLALGAVQARLELLDAQGDPLGTIDATATGESIALQNVPIVAAGAHTIRVTQLGGAGSYRLTLTLNAAEEAEHLGLGANDTIAQAQAIDASAVALPNGADRLGVWGTAASAGDFDYYGFDINANEPTSIVAAALDGIEESVGLDLFLQDGTLLAIGQPTGTNHQRTISGLLLGATTRVYARLSIPTAGANSDAYSLLVARGAAFENEPNNTLDDAKPVVVGPLTLGALSGTGLSIDADFRAPGGGGGLDGFTATGLWHVTSTATGAGLSGHTAPEFAYFGITAQNNFDAGRVSGTLTSELHTIPAGSASSLKFNYRLSSESGTFYDRAEIRLIKPDDTVLAVIATKANVFAQTSAWTPVSLDLSAYASQTFRVQFWFDSIDSVANSGFGWQIDDVRLSGPDVVDSYLLPASAGDALTLSTTTPLDGAGEPQTGFDPVIDLYSPAGILLASDDNSGSDGKNALLNHTVADAGVYKVVVRRAGATGSGVYTLLATGSTAVSAPFTVSATTPADGTELGAFPATYRVVFDQPARFDTLTAADLTINGIAATGLTIVDAKTVDFAIANSYTGDGVYVAEIAAGAVTSVTGLPLAAFSADFDSDVTAPVVIASSVATGDVVAPGNLVYVVQFSEGLATADLGAEDVTLVDVLTGALIAPASFVYDAGTATVTVGFDGLLDGQYTLTLLTSATAIRDRRGNLLDGSPSFPLPSGDNSPGDPFVVEFQVDTPTVPLPLPLVAVPPVGSLIYQGTQTSALNALGDVDTFTIDLDAGMLGSARFTPQDASQRVLLEIVKQGGAIVASATSSAPGAVVVIQSAALLDPETYALRVTGLEGTGRYVLELLVNAAYEAESVGGASNDAMSGAETLAAALTLPAGGERLGVVGRLGAADTDYYALTLAANQYATIGLTSGSNGAVGLQLLDAAGTVLAAGESAITIGQALRDFRAPAAGVYLVKVTGADNQDYSLFATRSASFDIESNDADTGLAQTPTGLILGAIQARDISLEPDDYSVGTVLNSVVAGVTVSAPGSGSNVTSATSGLASTGARVFSRDGVIDWYESSGTVFRADFTAPVPTVSIDAIGDDSADPAFLRAYNTANVLIAEVVTDGGTAGVARTLTINRSQSDIAYILAGGVGGDTLALDNLRVTGDGSDNYTFEALAGQSLELVTTTPAGGAGAFVNNLDPRLELYSPEGFLVAVDENSGGDNRNARIDYTVPAGGGGVYRVRLIGAGLGEYTLHLGGVTPTPGPGPLVVSSTPANGEKVASAPTSIEVRFSESILLTSVDASDLVVDGGSVTGVEVIDARTLRFAVSVPDVEGSHGVSIAAGALLDLQGVGSVAYAGSFEIDKTGPVVVSQVPALQASSPFNQLTFTFNEAIDGASFTTADVVSFVGPGGTNLLGSLTSVTGAGDTFTVAFSNQTARGTYTMTIGPNITDTVGNSMASSYTATVSLQSPDLIVTGLTTPLSAVFGNAINVSWSVKNQGDDPAVEAWKDRVYLSSNTSLDSGDTLLYTLDVGSDSPLAPGGTYAKNPSVPLPLVTTLLAGNYYIIVQTDALGTQSESSESNNTRVSELISIDLPPLPDLVVSEIIAPVEAFAGQGVTITWKLKNEGTGPADGSWSDYLYLSSNDSVGGDQFFGAFSFTGTIAAGEELSRTQVINLPDNMVGDRWVVLTTDAAKQIYEHAKEGNNTTIDDAPMNVKQPPRPNLQVTQVTAPPSAFSSQSTLIEWVVSNVGTGATSAPSWIDRVYLSTDTTLDNADVYLGDVENPSYLAAGDSYVNSLTVKLPQGIDGDYYFIVYTDIYGQVFEFDKEGDNTRAGGPTDVNLTPPPDLQVDSVNAPANAFSGQVISVAWTVINKGTGQTLETAWTDRVFLSVDNVLSNDDVSLATLGHGGRLEVDETYTTSANVTLPIGIEGDFFMFVLTDAFKNVYEHANESNNSNFDSFHINLTPPPDLEVEAVNGPPTARAGTPLSLFYRVTNFGATPTPNGSWTDRFYLSGDTALDGSDLLLGSRTHSGALDVGESYEDTVSYTLPNGISGPFHVLVHTDATNAVFELDNLNNIAADASPTSVVSLPADLVVSETAVPGNGTAGQTVRVEWTVQNFGTGDTIRTTWTDSVYISPNADMSGAALLANFTRNNVDAFGNPAPLPVGGTYARNELVEIPIAYMGNYYIAVATDTSLQVFESNDGNNRAPGRLIVIARETADLQTTAVSAPASAQSGGTLQVDWTVKNFGSVVTNTTWWEDAVYLSADTALDAGDIQLGRVTRSSALGPQLDYSVSHAFTLPIDLQGTYYLIVSSDITNRVFEGSFDGNNDKTSTGTTTVTLSPVADLIVGTVDAPIEGISGQPFLLDYAVHNVGGAATTAGFWDDGVYLSRDQVFDPGTDLYVGARRHNGNLAVGEGYTVTGAPFTIPRGQSGPFYAFVVADVGNRVYERANESNNRKHDPVSMDVILPPPADLVAGTITVPANAVVGKEATIQLTIENAGDDAALGSWYDSVYISADDKWDIGDKLFARLLHTGNVAAGTSYPVVAKAPLPAVVPGDYHVIVRTDIRNNIAESDETNNLGASLDLVDIDVEELLLGVPAANMLGQGQSVYYKVANVPAGETLLIDFDSAHLDAFNEVYVRFGALPTRGQFDYAFETPFEPDQRVIVPVTQAGTYYILAYGDVVPGGASGFDIEAKILEFSVLEESFGQGGTAGNLTLRVTGAKYDRTITAALRDPNGTESPAIAYYFKDSSRFYPTFDLSNLAPGSYDLIVRNSSGSEVLVLDALDVVFAAPGKVSAELESPASVRRNTVYGFRAVWSNATLNDLPVPYLIVGNTVPFGDSAQDTSQHGTALGFWGQGDGDVPGILRPGDTGTRSFFSRSDAFPGNHMTYIDVVGSTTGLGDFDWDSIGASLRPARVSLVTWNQAFALLKSQVGSTTAEVLAEASANAALVTANEQDVPLAELLGPSVDRALFETTTSLRGRVLAPNTALTLLGKTIVAKNLGDGTEVDALLLADGTFTLYDLAPGDYELTVLNLPAVQNQFATPIHLGAGSQVDNLEIRVTGHYIGGVVSLAAGGFTLPGAFVGLYSGTTAIATQLTESGGVFRLDAIPDGTYDLMIMAEGLARQFAQVNVLGGNIDLEIVLQQQSRVIGLVTDAAAAPLDGVTVVAHRAGDPIGFDLSTTTEAGAFDLGNLSDGVYSITFKKSGYLDLTLNGVVLSTGTVLDLGVIELEEGFGGGFAGEVFQNDWRETSMLALARATGGPLGLTLFAMYAGGTGPWPTIPLGGSAPAAFKSHSKTQNVLKIIADDFAQAVQKQLESEYPDGLPCDHGDIVRSFNVSTLSSLVPLLKNPLTFELLNTTMSSSAGARDQWTFSFYDGTLPGAIAGGVGAWGGPGSASPVTSDFRYINGSIKVTIPAKSSQASLQFDLDGLIGDGVDFVPGNTAYGLFDFAAARERAGLYWDVPFTVDFKADPIQRHLNLKLKDDCDRCSENPPPADCDDIPRPQSVDPNDIIGPEGFGTEKWVSAFQALPYTIRFENDPAVATAPAQVVTINQILDADLDPRTFRVGDFGFGDIVVDVPDNKAFYTTRIDLTKSQGIYVDVIAGINIATREAYWQFTSIDPATGDLPIDALLGFLPPNVDGVEGQGFVTYTVKPRASAKTGDVIDAEATIVFDINEPIDTPPIFNTLDAAIPVSQLDPLPTTDSDGKFLVSWTGDDPAGAGLAGFTVFVSIDGKAFAPWLENVTYNSAEYIGPLGHTYAFFVVASDNAGNIEAAPESAEGTVNVPLVTVPTVDNTVVQNGMAQRSYVDTYAWTFSEAIQWPVDVSAFALVNLGVNAPNDADTTVPLTAAQFSYDAATFTVTWKLDPNGVLPLNQRTLADGYYRWTLDASQILGATGIPLDGDNDDLPGGNFTVNFHRLEGDVDGNKIVNSTDTNLVKKASGSQPGYATWNPNADLTRDGRVNAFDLAIVAKRQGKMIITGEGITQVNSTQATPRPAALVGSTLNAELFGDVSNSPLGAVSAVVFAGAGIAPVWSGTVIAGLQDSADLDWFRLAAPASGTLDLKVNRAGIVFDVFEGQGGTLKPVPNASIPVVGGREYYFQVKAGLGVEAHGLAYQLEFALQQYDAYLDLIGLSAVRADSNLTGAGYSVAVLDSGIDYTRPEFGGRVILGPDFGDGDLDPMDLHGHGTHVAGIIGSQNGHAPGVASGADLVALKITPGSSLTTTTSILAQALQWVIDNRVAYNIVALNLSFGGGNVAKGDGVAALEPLFQQLAAAGVFIAAASGNANGPNTPDGLSALAASSAVAAVGAVWDSNAGPASWSTGARDLTTAADRITSFTQRTEGLDLLAPGGDILNLNLRGGLAEHSGTSMAAPMVAGASVLLRQAAEAAGLKLTPGELLDLLKRSGKLLFDGDDESDNVENTDRYYRRLDLAAALAELATLAKPAAESAQSATGLSQQSPAPVVKLPSRGSKTVTTAKVVSKTPQERALPTAAFARSLSAARKPTPERPLVVANDQLNVNISTSEHTNGLQNIKRRRGLMKNVNK